MSSTEFTAAGCWAGKPVARRIADIVPRGRVVVTGVIYHTEVTQERGTPSYECLLDDGSGQLGLLFLGRRDVAGIVVGTRCTVEGTARMEGSRYVLWNPLYRIEPSDQ
jgi:hypothetical protein